LINYILSKLGSVLTLIKSLNVDVDNRKIELHILIYMKVIFLNTLTRVEDSIIISFFFGGGGFYILQTHYFLMYTSIINLIVFISYKLSK